MPFFVEVGKYNGRNRGQCVEMKWNRQDKTILIMVCRVTTMGIKKIPADEREFEQTDFKPSDRERT